MFAYVSRYETSSFNDGTYEDVIAYTVRRQFAFSIHGCHTSRFNSDLTDMRN